MVHTKSWGPHTSLKQDSEYYLSLPSSLPLSYDILHSTYSALSRQNMLISISLSLSLLRHKDTPRHNKADNIAWYLPT